MLIVIDVDDALWGVAEPASPHATAFFRQRAHEQGRTGGNRFAGRHLKRVLHAAGFENPQLDAFCYDSDSTGLAAFAHQLDPRHYAGLLTAGAVSLPEYLTLATESRAFLADPTAFVLAIGFIAWGVNGAG
jgi:hypothetical protein